MTNSKPSNPFPPMKKATMAERIIYAAALLHIYGFSSDAENTKIKERIRKWIDAARKGER